MNPRLLLWVGVVVGCALDPTGSNPGSSESVDAASTEAADTDTDADADVDSADSGGARWSSGG